MASINCQVQPRTVSNVNVPLTGSIKALISKMSSIWWNKMSELIKLRISSNICLLLNRLHMLVCFFTRTNCHKELYQPVQIKQHWPTPCWSTNYAPSQINHDFQLSEWSYFQIDFCQGRYRVNKQCKQYQSTSCFHFGDKIKKKGFL